MAQCFNHMKVRINKVKELVGDETSFKEAAKLETWIPGNTDTCSVSTLSTICGCE